MTTRWPPSAPLKASDILRIVGPSLRIGGIGDAMRLYHVTDDGPVLIDVNESDADEWARRAARLLGEPDPIRARAQRRALRRVRRALWRRVSRRLARPRASALLPPWSRRRRRAR